MSAAPKKRAPRRDAIANHELILDQAEQLFTSEGLEVSFHRIAQQLGVGVGTVYRHFPNRDHLLLGLYRRYQKRIDDHGDRFWEADPGLARMLVFIDVMIDLSVGKPLARRVAARVQQAFPEEVAVNPWAGEIAAAIEQAKADGDIRPDAQPADIAILAGMIADLATIEEPRRQIILPRMRAYILDSLRPVGAVRPPLPADELSIPDLTAIAHQQQQR